MIDLLILKNELLTDPRAYGYAAPRAAGDHQTLANMLNTLRTAANNGNVATAITVRRGVRTAIEVMNAITLAEFEVLTVARQQYILALVTPVDGVDLSNDTIRANLAAVFPAGSASRAALLLAADKTPASRGEELFGITTAINTTHIAAALNS